jgi:hypothetical protein
MLMSLMLLVLLYVNQMLRNLTLIIPQILVYHNAHLNQIIMEQLIAAVNFVYFIVLLDCSPL